MSTNTTVPNFPIFSTDHFMAIWKLTRAIKAAGWKYIGSADGTGTTTNKDTTGITSVNGSPLTDKWGPGGIVANHIQLTSTGTHNGSAATISALAGSKVTITGLTDMANPSTGAGSVGHALQMSGATNAVNNGIFTIVEYVSSTSVKIFNPVAVSEATSLTWSERVSGTSSITWSSITNNREQIISGLARMTPSSAGHFIYLHGSSSTNNNGVFTILSCVSPSSVVVINNNTSSVGADTASGYWTELDPILDVYPLTANLGYGSWIVFQGPNTLKVPINAASTGTFITGELVRQIGSDGYGELLGYQFDTVSSSGYLVLMPRRNGSGAGRLGWNNGSSTIVGITSGTSVTTATFNSPVEFVREIVFWKGNTQLNGHIYNQCVDAVGESTSRFSYLMTLSSCTGGLYNGTQGIAPGAASGTFPALGSYVAKGDSASMTSYKNWFILVPESSGMNSVGLSRSHFMVADADYSFNKSADGTFTVAVGNVGVWGGSDNTSPPHFGCYSGFGFYRLDNTEYGDVDPYVWYIPCAANFYADARIGPTADVPSGSSYQYIFSDHFNSYTMYRYSASTVHTAFKGFRRRGFAISSTVTNSDNYQQFQLASLCVHFTLYQNVSTGIGTSGGFQLSSITTPFQEVIAHSLSPVPKKIRDQIWIVSLQDPVSASGGSSIVPTTGGRMRKGTLRWITLISGGNAGQTFNNKTYVQLSGSQGNGGDGQVSSKYGQQGNWVVGPWDGITPVLQT